MFTQFCSQRPTLGAGGPSLSSAGCSSQASGIGIPIAGPPLTQGVLGVSTSTQGVGGSIRSMPSAGELTLTQSFSGSSQASSTDIRAAPTLGLRHFYMCLYVY